MTTENRTAKKLVSQHDQTARLYTRERYKTHEGSTKMVLRIAVGAFLCLTLTPNKMPCYEGNRKSENTNVVSYPVFLALSNTLCNPGDVPDFLIWVSSYDEASVKDVPVL